MKNVIIRLQNVIINNFKNVEYGKITFDSYNNVNLNTEFADILGVYGQNGSGKTALVDVMSILKHLVQGYKLPEDMNYLISSTSKTSKLDFMFLYERLEEKYILNYSVEIAKGEDEKKATVTKEVLSFSPIVDGNKKPKIRIIDYDANSDVLIKPQIRYTELINADKNNAVNLGVANVYSLEQGLSFIFNERALKIFEKGFNNKIYSNIIFSLRKFALMDLFVFKNDQLSVINTNQVLPLTFRIDSEEKVVAGNYPSLFGTSIISEEEYQYLKDIIKQKNIVIKAIIPDLEVAIADYGQRLDEEGNIKYKVELISVRGENRVPLKYESDGIKKILSILSAMIAMYNNRAVCLVVDELDAGIYEYLLGEILGVLYKNAKGQLIFTSHNLRVLEKINKESIIFTTTNPKNRYIRLTNVKSNNNLRDFYFRTILLGGQKEEVYQETNIYEMNFAFKRAGRLFNGK